MKVLQLGKFFPIRGGVEKVMWDITRGLRSRGIRCEMLCAKAPGGEVPPEGMICVRSYAKIAGTMIAPAMIPWMREHAGQYDILHIHHPDPMAALALWMSGYKGRVIVHWHSDIVSQRFFLFFYRPLQGWLLRRAEKIVGTSPVYLRESPFLKKVQDKCTCIPIGIEKLCFDPEEAEGIRKRFGGNRLVFSLGRLVPYKAYSNLVRAAAELPEDYSVVIGGDGPEREMLTSLISELGLEHKVHLAGYIPDGASEAYFGACDVFVLCSRWKTEAFGIVQIEAMSCGKPVVATEIPQSGVPWVNEDGVSGLNVPVDDPSAIASAICRICSSPDYYERLSQGAAKRFEETFTMQMMIDKTIQLYEEKI